MGSELVNNSLPFRFYDIFMRCLPYYLTIGMPSDEFWNGDCCLVKCYREADKYRQQRMNSQAWLQGAYVYEALCDVAPVLHAFAKRGAKPHKYSAEPYAASKEEQTNKEKIKSMQAKAKMQAWAERINKMRGEKREREHN